MDLVWKEDWKTDEHRATKDDFFEQKEDGNVTKLTRSQTLRVNKIIKILFN